MDNTRRFIEETFPVKEVSAESAREKNIRHGHISTLHIWWARKPLASSRAINYASLIPAVSRQENPEEWNRKRDFISKFAKWENSLDHAMIEQACKSILEANGGKPPKVLDPFAGGGSVCLESLRLGCETYASDYNPVAVLIEKCAIEYPQKFGRPGKIEKEVEEFGQRRKVKIEVENILLQDVEKWGERVLKEARQEIEKFYPSDKDGSIPVAWCWMRTIPCQNPACEVTIPLTINWWLCRKANKKVALCPITEGGSVNFNIVGDGYANFPVDYDPSEGTISRAVVTCPVCGAVVDAKTTRQLFQGGKAGQRMVAIVLRKPGLPGKTYRLTTDRDIQTFQEAEQYLKIKRKELMATLGVDPIPDEPLPLMSGVFNVPIYCMNTWGSLFNARQKLVLITFIEKIRKAFKDMLEEGYPRDYAKVVVTYLGIGLDRVVIYQTTLGYWHNTRELVNPAMGRQALGMNWDYAEGNPFGGNADWRSAINWILKVIDHCAHCSKFPATITQASAESLPYEDNYFDAVLTDPPYYFNVPYAELSDFFYVWLKRTVGDLYPSLFSTPLTPKANEIVQMRHWDRERYPQKSKEWFETKLTNSFKEIHRVLRPNGIAVIVYAHKSTEGWETLINSLLDSDLIVTGAWPLNTEMQERLRSKESATLSSSIYIVARKIERQPTGFYNEVLGELKSYINQKLDSLWQEGIGGADFFIAAIGSAIEIFGKYEKVMDYEGKTVRADRLLEAVRKIATDYAVKQILHDGFAGEISDLTRFYVLWRWNYGAAKVEFDEANKLARSCGIDLAREWNRPGFIQKQKEFIRVFGPQDRKLDSLGDSSELIDILHRVLLLWEKSKRDEIKNVLYESAYGTSEAFYRVAQAISETLPNESKEKKLLDGFLAGKERIKDEIKQGRLFK